MHRVVVEAADAGAANAGGFSLEIEHLPDQSALPEEPPVHPIAVCGQQRLETGQHAKAEEALAGDVLVAREAVGHPGDVGGQQQEQVRRRGVHSLPEKFGTHRGAQVAFGRRVAQERVDTRLETFDPVHEEHQVHRRRPVDRVPRRRRRPHASQHGKKRIEGKRAPRIEAHGAAAAQDHLTRAKRVRARSRRGVRNGQPAAPAGGVETRVRGGARHVVDRRPVHVAAAQRVGLPPPLRGQQRRDERGGCPRDRRGRVARGDHRQARRRLALGSPGVGVAVDPEQGRDLGVRPAREQRRMPPKERRRKPERPDGVSDIVLAVTVGALAVLPRLAPVD